MKKFSVLFLILSAIVMVSAVAALGQEKTAAPDREATFERSAVVTTPQGQSQVAPSVNYVWFSSEFSFDGKLVKGAPYSAQAVTETTQTLSDGNRIVNKSTATLYRDSEGRTRREQTLNALGNFASGEPMQIININDPVAGVSYSLDPSTRVARKNQSFRFERTPAAAGAVAGGNGSGSMQFKVITTPGAEPKVATGGEGQVFMKSEASQGTFFKQDAGGKNFVKESLGKQMIEGVDAEGTRTTVTIPAGAIGNERPIEIVDERWYSPSLQTVVMTRHTDPRSGEIVYRLTNIDRNEPAHSLFEVPGDYQLKEGPAAPMPMRVRKPMD